MLRGTPSESIETSMSSLSNSSFKQYDCCFKKWWNFCKERSLNPFLSSVPEILVFLSELFDNGAAHNSINCYRSAISLLVGPEMATDPRILRFFRGISKLRPSKPKYDSTWDPKIVLKYFTSLPSNEELSIKQLAKKLICLLALITGLRM